MLSIIGEVQTPLAASYLARLCKHFKKEIPIEYNETEGYAQFPFGSCRLRATSHTLTFQCEAEDQTALDRVRSVMEHHMTLFTRREPLTITWQPSLNTDQH